MKLISFLFLLIALVSCKQGAEKDFRNKPINIQDTILKKQRNKIDKLYEVGLYSKSYSYYWLVGKDTLDIRIYATEYLSDSTLNLNIHHNNPVLFDTVLTKIIESLPIIQVEFNTSKLSSLYFRSPIYYPDIVNDLTGEYNQKFGEKIVDYHKLNVFLLQSNLNKNLNNFLDKIDKEVQNYSIEKFQLLSQEHYKSYLSDENSSTYPEFSIHGMGIYVQIRDQAK